MKKITLTHNFELHIVNEGIDTEFFVLTNDYLIELHNPTLFQKAKFDDLLLCFSMFFDEDSVSHQEQIYNLMFKCGIKSIHLKDVIIDEHGDVPNLSFNIYKYLIDNEILF